MIVLTEDKIKSLLRNRNPRNRDWVEMFALYNEHLKNSGETRELKMTCAKCYFTVLQHCKLHYPAST